MVCNRFSWTTEDGRIWVNNYLPIFFCFQWFCSGPCCGGNDSSNNNNKKKESTQAKFYFKTKLPKSCCLSCIHTHTHSLLVCVCVCVSLPRSETGDFWVGGQNNGPDNDVSFQSFRLVLMWPVLQWPRPSNRMVPDHPIPHRISERIFFPKFCLGRLTHPMTNNGQEHNSCTRRRDCRDLRSARSSVFCGAPSGWTWRKLKRKKFLRLRPAFPSVAGHSVPHVYGRRQFRPKKGKKMFGSYFQNASFLRVLFMASRQPHSSVRIPRYRTHHPPQ